MTNRIGTTVPSVIRPEAEQAEKAGNAKGKENDFQSMLEDVEADVRFSNHAAKRIERRNIPLTKDDLALLDEGISRAEQKGSKESLLLLEDTAFVVNVNSRTVITAVKEAGMKEKAFTNIDSAILLKHK